MFEMTYDFDRILGLAVEMGDDGWSRCIIDVAEGETAYLPGTTKKMLLGPGKFQYDIHATGVTVKHVGHKDPSDIKCSVQPIPSV